jgi:hypothetical protein
MKKSLKATLALALALTIALAAAAVSPLSASAATAEPSGQRVTVNGAEAESYAYIIDGSNYFKLRDIALMLKDTEKQFEVAWDGELNAIYLTSGAPYTVVGGEFASKGQSNKNTAPTASEIYKDGSPIMLTAYTIDGNNYFMLRDIGLTFDFGVDWDEASRTVVIDTGKNYSAADAATVLDITWDIEDYTVISDALAIFGSGAETAYDDAKAFFDAKIAAATGHARLKLQLAKADFYIVINGLDIAEDYLDSLSGATLLEQLLIESERVAIAMRRGDDAESAARAEFYRLINAIDSPISEDVWHSSQTQQTTKANKFAFYYPSAYDPFMADNYLDRLTAVYAASGKSTASIRIYMVQHTTLQSPNLARAQYILDNLDEDKLSIVDKLDYYGTAAFFYLRIGDDAKSEAYNAKVTALIAEYPELDAGVGAD